MHWTVRITAGHRVDQHLLGDLQHGLRGADQVAATHRRSLFLFLEGVARARRALCRGGLFFSLICIFQKWPSAILPVRNAAACSLLLRRAHCPQSPVNARSSAPAKARRKQGDSRRRRQSIGLLRCALGNSRGTTSLRMQSCFTPRETSRPAGSRRLMAREHPWSGASIVFCFLRYFSLAAYLDGANLRALWGLVACNMAWPLSGP